MMEWNYSITDTGDTAARLLALASGRNLFLLIGQLGAGKTTLIKSVCQHLGVQEPTSSPTFSLVNTYSGAAGPVYHFDLYRLKSLGELADIGFTEYLDSQSPVFIEWPELVIEQLDEIPQVRIYLSAESPDSRHIRVECI